MHNAIHTAMCRKSRFVTGLAVTILLVSAATAGERSLPTETDFFTGIPLVSAATRLPQSPEETPALVTVIDREMIRASGAVNIADLFRLVPGFQVSHVNGHDFAVTSHGLADEFPRRLLVQVDGRSLHTSFNSTIYWSSVPLEIEDIERIEVISGPNAASYGANAFNGVINITTRRPFQDQGNYLNLTAGTQSTARGMYRHGDRAGDLQYRVSASHQRDSGIDTVHDDTRVSKLSFSGNYQQNLHDQFDIQFGLTEGDFGIGQPNDEFEPHRTRDAYSHYEYLRWTRALNPTDSVYVQFFHNRYKMDDEFTFGPILDTVNNILLESGAIDTPLTNEEFMQIFSGELNGEEYVLDGNQTITHGLDDIDTHRYDLELQHSLQVRDDIRLLWGAGLRYDTIEGRHMLDGDHDEEDVTSRLFATLEQHLSSRLVLNASANYEYNGITGGDLSPRIGLNYQVVKNHTLRAAAARAYRTPSLLEAYQYTAFEPQNAPPLVRKRSQDVDEPEEITSLELGYIGHWLDRALTLDIKLYRERISPVIETVQDKRNPADDPYGLANFVQIVNNDIGTVDIEGLEARLALRPRPKSFVSLQYGYANPKGIYTRWYMQGDEFAGTGSCPEPPDANNFFRICNPFDRHTPQHSFSLLASHAFDEHWQASTAAYYNSGFVWFGNGDRLPRYRRYDARLARSFRSGGHDGELSLVVQNLGGDYLEFRDDNPFDTRVYLQLALAPR